MSGFQRCISQNDFSASSTFCTGEGGGGDQEEAREVIGDEINKGGDSALPQVEGELASSTTEQLFKVDEEIGFFNRDYLHEDKIPDWLGGLAQIPIPEGGLVPKNFYMSSQVSV